MKLGSMVMILRPGFRVLNGNHPVLMWKKHVNQDPTSRWWRLFFDLDGIVRAKFVPRNTMVNSEYYKGLLERLWNDVRGKDLRNGQTVSSSIMTTLCVTHCFWYSNFCQIKILRRVLIHLIHLIWHHVTSSSSPKSKRPWKVNILNRFRTSRQPRQRN